MIQRVWKWIFLTLILTPSLQTQKYKCKEVEAPHLRSSSDTSFLCHPSSSVVRDLFLMLHRRSGTVSLSKLDRQTYWHLWNRLWNFTSSSYAKTRVWCLRARAWVCCDCFGVLCFVIMGCALQSGKKRSKEYLGIITLCIVHSTRAIHRSTENGSCLHQALV